MKKIITLLLTISCFLSSFSFTKEDVNIAIDNLCKEIMFSQPQSYYQENYVELSYLKRNFNLTGLNLSDSAYKSKIINNYYYDQYYLYSKFLNENAVVTEDCLHAEGTETLYKGSKILFYTLYPNSIKLPTDILEQIEEQATMDEFFGPYSMLIDIYYLKKYNYKNLSAKQKEKLIKLEDHLSKILYTKYIENKSWAFYKLLSTKVLKMNDNPLVKNLDISIVVDYFKNNKPLYVLDEDRIDKNLLIKFGSKKIIQMQANAILWIFLLEIK